MTLVQTGGLPVSLELLIVIVLSVVPLVLFGLWLAWTEVIQGDEAESSV